MNQHALSLRHLVETPIRNVAEAIGGTVVGSGYFWLPLLEEGLRVAVGIAGLTVALLQGYLAWRQVRAMKKNAP